MEILKDMDLPHNITVEEELRSDFIILPKWPALVVIGEAVSKEDAKEILVRTMDVPYSGSFRHEVYEVLGLEVKDGSSWPWPCFDDCDRVRKELGILDLHYLRNERVMSSWIGGAHGWCDWDGAIGCANYNIGKWPSIGEVAEDWCMIAEAFPQLTLKSYLFDGERCESPSPLVCFEVQGGKVHLRSIKDDEKDIQPDNVSPLDRIVYGTEQGCSIGEFADAVELTKKRKQERAAGY